MHKKSNKSGPSLKLNIILNGVKQLCAIFFPLITFPYVSRVLGSDGFGKYSFSNSIVGYFLLLAAMGISTYAIREGAKIRDQKEQLGKFCNQVFSINLCSAIESFVLLMILIVSNEKILSYASLIYVQSLAIFLNTLGTDWVNSIYEDYKYITIRYIIIQLISLLLVFCFVKSPDDVLPYCLICTFASAGGNLFNIIYVRRYVKIRFTFHMNIKRHILPMLVLFINSIAVSVYVSSDITMLGFFCGDTLVGVYSFATKIYTILKQLVHAMIIVSIPRIAYVIKNQPEKYNRYMNMLFQGLTIVLLPIAVGTFCISENIVLFVGGIQYVSGSSSLRLLSIALVFAIYSALFTNCVLIANGHENKCLISTLISAMVNISINLILIPQIGLIGAAITTIIAEVINFILQVYFSKDVYHWKKLDFKNTISCLVGCVGIFICCMLLKNITSSNLLNIIICVISSVTIYLLNLIVLKNYMVLETLNGNIGDR